MLDPRDSGFNRSANSVSVGDVAGRFSGIVSAVLVADSVDAN